MDAAVAAGVGRQITPVELIGFVAIGFDGVSVGLLLGVGVAVPPVQHF